MKRILILCCLLLSLLSACKPKTTKVVLYRYDPSKNIKDQLMEVQKENEKDLISEGIYPHEAIAIGEKLFISQINDIYYNFDDYKNYHILVEGMFTHLENTKKEKVPAVYRLGPGCCNNDGWAGFLMANYDFKNLKENDWIKVYGKPRIEINGHFRELYLDVLNIEVLEKRGAELVLD